jgi:hypothetical protein
MQARFHIQLSKSSPQEALGRMLGSFPASEFEGSIAQGGTCLGKLINGYFVPVVLFDSCGSEER